jgi:hypothetical protein
VGIVQPAARRMKIGIRNSLYQKLCAVFAVVMVTAFLLITLASGIISRNIAEKDVVDSSELLLKSLNDSLSTLLSDCENISRSILNNDSLQRYLTSDGSGNLQDLKKAARSELVNLSIFRNAVESIVVYNAKGREVSVGTSPSYVVGAISTDDSPWADEARAKLGMFFWTSAEFARGQSRVFLARVVNAKNSRIPVGMMAIVLSNEYLNAMVESLGEEAASGFFVYGSGGNLMFSDANVDFQAAMDAFYTKGAASGSIDSYHGTGYLVVTYRMPHTGWTLCRLVKASGILNEYRANLLIMIIIGIVCTLLAFAVFSHVTRGITNAVNGSLPTVAAGFTRKPSMTTAFAGAAARMGVPTLPGAAPITGKIARPSCRPCWM